MAVYIVGFLFFLDSFLIIHASYHWIVTESGRITTQVENSGFPLTRHDDLIALLEQELRISTVSKLYKELMSLERSIDKQWSEIEGEGEEDLEKRLYSSDIDCILGEMPLSQHNLHTEFLDYGQGTRPKMKGNIVAVEPDCTAYSELDFSMRTFPHLETLNKRGNFNLSVNPVPSKKIFNLNIDAMLKQNTSDWTAYNLASLYWRTMGNGTNAVECARRALYFSPRNKRYIVLLNLGTLLQELDSLGEAAIILHSAVDHDPVQQVSHLALGNVYAALGDYNRSLACYENVLSLNPGNERALQLKHALLCHKKLESGLVEIHSALQKILQDLRKHYAMHEEWLLVQNQINWERDNKVKEFLSLSQPIYLNLQMLLKNVERQAKSLNEEVTKRFSQKKQSKFSENLETRVKEEVTVEEEEEEEEESELENFVSSEEVLRNKMNSLITFMKSNYEEEINFRKKISHQLNLIKELKGQNEFSLDRSLLFRNMDSCVTDSCDVKKLN